MWRHQWKQKGSKLSCTWLCVDMWEVYCVHYFRLKWHVLKANAQKKKCVCMCYNCKCGDAMLLFLYENNSYECQFSSCLLIFTSESVIYGGRESSRAANDKTRANIKITNTLRKHIYQFDNTSVLVLVFISTLKVHVFFFCVLFLRVYICVRFTKCNVI